ncbi:MAG: apolipoprotein N-acyltransferase [Alphaproteobacteria bacterium]|jgi:apolipoprotein N-acyltransferase|nr:apolipoprotein N-acyltransferase [Alphaproteobacteria bacterium]
MFSFKHKFLPTSTFGRFSFCFLLGCIGGGAMGPLYLWYNLLIGLSFFWILLTEFSKQSKWKSAFAGWLFGFGYFIYSLYWIGNALLVDGNPYLWAYPLAVCGLPALLALFPAVAAGLARIIRPGRDFWAYIVFLACFMVIEYVRGYIFSGFPWNLYGMAWTGHLPMLQILSVGGIYFLSFLTIFMFSAPAFAFKGTAPRFARIGVLCLAIGIGISLYAFGIQRLAKHQTEYRDDVVIQIVQPNIPQEKKWDGSLMWDNFRSLINMIHRDGSLKGKGEHPARVLVLPESAMTYHHLNEKAALDALRGASGHFSETTYILTGALLKDQAGYHNSLIALNQQAERVYSFDKFHLVPFGEYIPFQKYIPFGPLVNFSGFVQGAGPQTAQLDGVPPFSPLVCYEVIFPGEVTSDNPVRPEWIVNVTNDAWYGLSPGPFQHMAHAIYRAIEEGLPVVRSANTGISTIIDPYGRVLTVIPLNSTYTDELYLPKPAVSRPLYSKFKNF